jgi:hypothetical protein
MEIPKKIFVDWVMVLFKRNKKRQIANSLLRELLRTSIITSGMLTNEEFRAGKTIPDSITTKKEYKLSYLSDLIRKGYNTDDINEAVLLLFSNKHIDLIESKGEYYNSSLKCTQLGELALYDDYYKDEISSYTNEKVYSITKIVLPVTAILLSLGSIVFTQCNNVQVKEYKKALRDSIYILRQESMKK